MSHLKKKSKTEEKEFLFLIGDIICDKSNNDHLLVLSYVKLNCGFQHYVLFDHINQETTENTIGYIEHFYKKI